MALHHDERPRKKSWVHYSVVPRCEPELDPDRVCMDQDYPTPPPTGIRLQSVESCSSRARYLEQLTPVRTHCNQAEVPQENEVVGNWESIPDRGTDRGSRLSTRTSGRLRIERRRRVRTRRGRRRWHAVVVPGYRHTAGAPLSDSCCNWTGSASAASAQRRAPAPVGWRAGSHRGCRRPSRLSRRLSRLCGTVRSGSWRATDLTHGRGGSHEKSARTRRLSRRQRRSR